MCVLGDVRRNCRQQVQTAAKIMLIRFAINPRPGAKKAFDRFKLIRNVFGFANKVRDSAIPSTVDARAICEFVVARRFAINPVRALPTHARHRRIGREERTTAFVAG